MCGRLQGQIDVHGCTGRKTTCPWRITNLRHLSRFPESCQDVAMGDSVNRRKVPEIGLGCRSSAYSNNSTAKLFRSEIHSEHSFGTSLIYRIWGASHRVGNSCSTDTARNLTVLNWCR